MSALSPATRRGIFHQLIARDNSITVKPKRRYGIEEITAWRCRECFSVYDDEDEAADCCPPEADNESTDPEADNCPVCGSGCDSPRDAADCCLWKDYDAPTRWRMADRVAAGATWAEVLEPEVTQ